MKYVDAAFEAFLWPGTKVCEYFGIQPTEEMGLFRSFINSMIYFPLIVIIGAIFW